MSKHTPGEGREPTMKLKTNAPLDMLKHHVTGAIQRGEATAIVAQSSKHTPILVELTPRKFVIGPFEAERCPENSAIARRIVACVNALEGIDDPAEFIRFVKELIAEIRALEVK